MPFQLRFARALPLTFEPVAVREIGSLGAGAGAGSVAPGSTYSRWLLVVSELVTIPLVVALPRWLATWVGVAVGAVYR